MSMLIEVWGDYACFTRPEMKTERVSYIVGINSAFLDFFRCQILCQLSHHSADHFHMSQFIRSYMMEVIIFA